MKNRILSIWIISMFFFSCKNVDKLDSKSVTLEGNNNYYEFITKHQLDTTASIFDINSKSKLVNHKSNLYPTSAFFDGGSKYEEYINEDGIPIHTIDKKKYFHPSQVAAYGLDLYFDFYKTNDSLILVKFLKQAKWLSENITEYEKFSTWEIPFDNKSFLIDAPYPSALTNSWGAGVLLIASQFENEELYFKQSKNAINYMLTNIEEGGGLAFFNEEIWFEEYPSIANTSHVLNGYLFSIDILHLFYEVTSEEIYLDFLQKAFTSLDKNLSYFDKDYGSIYDQFLKGNKIGNGYHKLHWIQLLWAYKISGNINFYITAKHFFEQEKQNTYQLKSDNCIDCERHGVEVLNNDKYWYGSWSARDKVINLEVDFNEVKEIYQFNFYSISKDNFPDSIMICGSKNETCITYNINKLDIKGYNKHKKYTTFVKTLFVYNFFVEQKLNITFFNPTKKTIALRNLGIQFFEKEELLDEYKKLNKKNYWNNRHVLPNQILN